jgi:hypothetical protein
MYILIRRHGWGGDKAKETELSVARVFSVREENRQQHILRIRTVLAVLFLCLVTTACCRYNEPVFDYENLL